MSKCFNWLADLNRSQSYTTCDWANPSRSTDFGFNGHTASLSDWHELLQLTAPDPYCGVVFIRGNFPNTADAILSRAQRRDHTGAKGTFGLEVVPDDSDFVLGEKRSQGLINFRWPYIQCELRRKSDDGSVEAMSYGTYEALSFIKDGILYQVVCLRLATGLGISAGIEEGSKISFRVGGTVQIGCLCSTGPLPSSKGAVPSDSNMLEVKNLGAMRLGCICPRYQKSVEMQLFVDDKPRDIGNRISQNGQDLTDDGMINLSTIESVKLKNSGPTIVVSTFALRDITDSHPLLTRESFDGIEGHLGIPVRSIRLTDRLWTACLTANYDAAEALEICAVAKSVEQILCVSSIPILKGSRIDPRNGAQSTRAFSTVSSAISSDGNGKQVWVTENKEEDMSKIALVRNIITTQYVDLQSMFWQIRLLAKVHRFLQTRMFKDDLLETMRPLDEIRSSYLSYLRKHIRKALTWMLEVNIEHDQVLLPVNSGIMVEITENNPRYRQAHECRKLRKVIRIDHSYNQTYYITLAIWFVVRHCPDAITNSFKDQFLWPKLKVIYELSERYNTESLEEPTSKNDVLRWFHMSCLLLICQHSPAKVDEHGLEINGFSIAGLQREVIIKSQENSEKSITRLRKSRVEISSIEDEEVDRLFLIGEELDFHSLRASRSASLLKARAEQTRQKISDRNPTTIINPGPVSNRQARASRTPSNGPWELYFLNHHTLLRTTLDGSSEISPQASRDTCFRFLLSDYTFMTSWDRADSTMVGKWWDLEPCSVISSTILDLKSEGKLKTAEAESLEATPKRSQSMVSTSSIETAPQMAASGMIHGETAILQHILADFLVQLEQRLAQKDASPVIPTKVFDWLAYKPGLTYHPRSWVISLETKPTNQTLLQHRRIHKFLSHGNSEKAALPLEWHLSQDPSFGLGHLDFLIVFELSLSQDLTFCQEEIRFRKALRSTGSSPRNSYSGGTKWNENSSEPSLTRLYRSLVDSGTKYRILFAERCSPSVVHAFIRGWHPDALNTFENYFGISSQFADIKEDIWTTTITISHWSIETAKPSRSTSSVFDENRKKGPFPPEKVASLDTEKSEKEEASTRRPAEILEQRSTSLVMTGDLHGSFWLCSIWSPLTNYDSLRTHVKSLRETIELFIHQQAAGRCLVFLILLGHLCEKLAQEYEAIMSELNIIVGLGETVLTEGLDWETAITVAKLKKMVWGLETLQLFDERLSSSLSQIRNAKESLWHTMEQEAVLQHVELVQGQKNILEEFVKRYGILSDVQAGIQLRIRQITGLRDGISTVTNVEDSRTALEDSQTTIRQGNNIRVLTLITIVYLPLGFVTGLFSVTRGIIPDDAGGALYAILVIVCMVITFTLALSLGLILKAILPWWEEFKQKFFGGDGKKGKRTGIKQNRSNEKVSRSRADSDEDVAVQSGREKHSRLPALLRLNGVAGKEQPGDEAAV